MSYTFIGDLDTKKLYNLAHVGVIEGKTLDDGSYVHRLHFAETSTLEKTYADVKAPKLVDSPAQVAAWIQRFELEMLGG